MLEKGQYICNSCNASIAEYRDFKKQDEAGEVGEAKPLEPQVQSIPQENTAPQQVAEQIPQETVTQPNSVTSITSIEGKPILMKMRIKLELQNKLVLILHNPWFW